MINVSLYIRIKAPQYLKIKNYYLKNYEVELKWLFQCYSFLVCLLVCFEMGIM